MKNYGPLLHNGILARVLADHQTHWAPTEHQKSTTIQKSIANRCLVVNLAFRLRPRSPPLSPFLTSGRNLFLIMTLFYFIANGDVRADSSGRGEEDGRGSANSCAPPQCPRTAVPSHNNNKTMSHATRRDILIKYRSKTLNTWNKKKMIITRRESPHCHDCHKSSCSLSRQLCHSKRQYFSGFSPSRKSGEATARPFIVAEGVFYLATLSLTLTSTCWMSWNLVEDLWSRRARNVRDSDLKITVSESTAQGIGALKPIQNNQRSWHFPRHVLNLSLCVETKLWSIMPRSGAPFLGIDFY